MRGYTKDLGEDDGAEEFTLKQHKNAYSECNNHSNKYDDYSAHGLKNRQVSGKKIERTRFIYQTIDEIGYPDILQELILRCEPGMYFSVNMKLMSCVSKIQWVGREQGREVNSD